MKKRMFFGFTLFVLIFTLVVWQYAAAELVELQKKPDSIEDRYTETV